MRKRSYSAEQARLGRRQFIHKSRRNFAAIGACAAALFAADAFVTPVFLRPYLFGATPILVAWVVHYVLWMGDGTYLQRKGAAAEQLTEEEFARLPGCRALGTIRFVDGDKKFDVDLVVSGPRSVYAVETKWTANSKLTADNLRRRIDPWLWQAKYGAADVRQLLAHAGVEVNVEAVLVLWGPGAPELPGGCARISLNKTSPVRVLAGNQADEWRPTFVEASCGEPWARGERASVEDVVTRAVAAEAVSRPVIAARARVSR